MNDINPLWAPSLIYSGYFTNNSDLDVSVEEAEIALKLFNTELFEKNDFSLMDKPLLACGQFVVSISDYWKCVMIEYTVSFSHPVGTCKMGSKSDPDAVVDERLRVRINR